MELKNLTKEYALFVRDEFLELYKEFELEKYTLSENEEVVVIEDSVVLFIKIDLNCEFMIFEENREHYVSKGCCGLDIEELTLNTIFPTYKHSPFLEIIEEKYGVYTYSIRYAKFRGINKTHLPNNMISQARYVMKKLPEVHLQERYDAWQGNTYNIVVFEMKGADGSVAYAVDAIKGKVHSYVLKIAKNFIDGNIYIDPGVGSNIGLSTYGKVDSEFIPLFRSHKNVRIVKRLQENMKYFSLEPVQFKEEVKIYETIKQVLEDVKKDKYCDKERIEYRKPENKWKSEELVYKLIKKMYKEYGVVYQHRPYYLKSSTGHQLSYDVYISSMKIAVEYQGKQHFEPVEYFGGQEAFERQKIRDTEKAEISKENGIKLIYINYWEEITPELIRMKIENTNEV